MAPLCARSVFPVGARGSQGSCPVRGLLRAGFVCELAQSGSCMDYSCWHPGKSLMAQRAAARQRNGSRLQPRAAAGAGLVLEQPRSRPASWAGACQQLRSSFSMRQQLREAPGPRCSAQPICCCRAPDLPRGRSNPRRSGAEILPQPLPAKCCNSSVVIPAWCCDTDAWREIQAPASSHSRGCCSRALVRAQPRLLLAPLDERENAAGGEEL